MFVCLLVIELRSEIDQLRSQLHGQSSSVSALVDSSSSVEVLSLKKQLQESERLVAEATLTWKQRLEQAERRKQEEVDKLKVGRTGGGMQCGVVQSRMLDPGCILKCTGLRRSTVAC